MEDIKILGLDVHGPLFRVAHTDIRDQLRDFITEMGDEMAPANFQRYLKYCDLSDKSYNTLRENVYMAKKDEILELMVPVEFMLHQYLICTWTFMLNMLQGEQFAKFKAKLIHETASRAIKEAIPVLAELKKRGIEKIIAVTSIPYTEECLSEAGFYGPIDKCCTSVASLTDESMPRLFRALHGTEYENWKVAEVGFPKEENNKFRLYYLNSDDKRMLREKHIYVPFLRGKTECLKLYAKHKGVDFNQIAFIGDGYSDLDVLKNVKYPILLSRGTERATSIGKWATNRNIAIAKTWDEVLELPIFRK